MVSIGRGYGFMIAGAAAIVLTATALFAGPHVLRHAGGFGFGSGLCELGPGGHLAAVLSELDLSQEQKDKIKAMLHEARPGLEPLLESAWESKRAVAEAIHAEAFDAKAVRQAAENAGRTAADLAVERARLVSELHSILTPEQRETLAGIRERFKSKMEHRLRLGRTIWDEHVDEIIDAL